MNIRIFIFLCICVLMRINKLRIGDERKEEQVNRHCADCITTNTLEERRKMKTKRKVKVRVTYRIFVTITVEKY